MVSGSNFHFAYVEFKVPVAYPSDIKWAAGLVSLKFTNWAKTIVLLISSL